MKLPFLGHGVGLRVPHYERALAGALEVDWVEVVTENFFGGGGRPRAVLERLRRDLPLVFHGVSLGIGSPGAPDPAYLAQLRALADQYEPAWLSDHLCWTTLGAHVSHDLLPLPYTEEALRHVSANVSRAQDALGRPLLLENVSSYVAFAASQLTEWEFLSALAERTGCLILLDLNNILVSAHNHGFSPQQYLEGIRADRVQQLHLANHADLGTHKFDDHRGPVPSVVWELYEEAWRRFGPVSSLVEWDEQLGSWEALCVEQREASARAERLTRDGSEPPASPSRRSAGRRLSSAPRRSAPSGSREGQGASPLSGTLSLGETQELFFCAITWPTGVRDFLQSSGESTRLTFERVLLGSPGFDRVSRLEVYADAYFYRLLAALGEVFPRLALLIGPVEFHNLITDYVLACPSTSPDLRRLGLRLPEFLREASLAQRWPLLYEVALFERALDRALDCPDGALVSEQDLARIPVEYWPELRFTFAPATQRLALRWELPRVEQLCRSGQAALALELPPGQEPRGLWIGRRGHVPYYHCPDAAEDAALSQLWQGATLGDACAEGERAVPGLEPAQLVVALRRWLADGMLAGVSAAGVPAAVGCT